VEALRDVLLSAEIPLHPAIVHVPLVLAAVAPAVLGWLVLRSWRRSATRVAWAVALALQCAVVAGGFWALRTGEAEEERVEAVVPEWPIEVHERRATAFVIGAAVVLAMIAAATAWPRTGRLIAPAALAASLVVATMGAATGHAGGELVYRHGAAQVYAGPPATPAKPATGGGDHD
jgi:uncharacterized membrane protein